MGKMIESWQSDDGKLFTSERDMVEHEALVALFELVPLLKDREAAIRSNINVLARVLKPLGDLQLAERDELTPATDESKPSPAVPRRCSLPECGALLADNGENQTVEDDGGCDCGALLAGNGGAKHLISCPAHPENPRAQSLLRASDRRKWDACQPVIDKAAHA